MVFKRFRFLAAARVIVLALTLFLFFYLIQHSHLYVTIVLVGVVVVWQIIAIVLFVDRTNRDLTRFLSAIKYGDFSQNFSATGLGASFAELHQAFKEVMAAIQEARAEREAQYRYLQTVVQHIGIGLVVFKPDGEVVLLNAAARRLLRIPYLQSVQALATLSQPLSATMLVLRSGEKTTVKVNLDGETLQLVVHATAFKLQEEHYTLVSLQNIGSELEEQEMEAWQKLTRVLAHEIMNSMTPIASLASTATELLAPKNGDDKLSYTHYAETCDDVLGALQTIEKRSKGLMHFVNAYRDLAHIPRPNFQICAVRDLLDRVRQLLSRRDGIADQSIDLSVQVRPESLEIIADPELIEQVLINLVTNAMQAVEKQPDAKIQLVGMLDNQGRTLIQVIDNGPGIVEEALEKIFVPFFTTKKGGSGIGLSISKQIMRLHRRTITVQSRPGSETVFTLRF